MLFPELEQELAIYVYSFICTYLFFFIPAYSFASEHWYLTHQYREIFRDSKHFS